MSRRKNVQYKLDVVNELIEKLATDDDFSLLEFDVLKDRLVSIYNDILILEKGSTHYQGVIATAQDLNDDTADEDPIVESEQKSVVDDNLSKTVIPDIKEDKTSNVYTDVYHQDLQIEIEEEVHCSQKDESEYTNNDIQEKPKVNVVSLYPDGIPIDVQEAVAKELGEEFVLEQEKEVKDDIEQVMEIETVELTEHITEEKYEEVKTVADNLVTDNITLHDNLVKQGTASVKTETVADKIRLGKVSDIKDAIGINDKFYFINKLFDGNVKLYNETIDKFNSYSSINDAKILLQLLMNKYNWDHNESSFQKFEEIIEKRFE